MTVRAPFQIALAGVAGVLFMHLANNWGGATPAPPRLVIRHDTVTVAQFETLAVVRTIEKTRVAHDTSYVERIITTRPETVTVLPHLVGLTELRVGRKIGDSTMALGFAAAPGDSSRVVVTSWLTQWWTPGPLRALTFGADGPIAKFDKPPRIPGPCGFQITAGATFTKPYVGAVAGYGCRL